MRFTNLILPKQAKDFTSSEIIKQLTDIFAESLSLSNVRYDFLKRNKPDVADYVTFASIVNYECRKL